MGELADLRTAVRRFAVEAGFDPVNTPKNLAISVSIEAAELLECFQWLEGADRIDKAKVSEEMADVLVYLIRLGDKLDIDLGQAVLTKLRKNKRRLKAGPSR